jgi:hypothetical protein
LQFERAGHGSIRSYLTEPESHEVIAGQDLRPDLHLEIAVPNKGVLARYVEVDLATERQKQLRDMMERYYQAWRHGENDDFPVIVFLVPNEYRRSEIRRIVSSGGDEWTALFHVELQEDFAGYLERTISG